jgi:signal transduction histidine kinase/ActR/RegA family two-component response regulator
MDCRMFGADSEISERRQAEDRLAATLAITQILADSPALIDAVPQVLQTIGETLGWEVGVIWTPDYQDNVLRCMKFWHAPGTRFPEFDVACRQRAFLPGIGLPGRVWKSFKPAWIPDVTRDSNFPRAPIADAEGLHGAFAFPILFGQTFLGVMEFFSREIREPDSAVLSMFASIGGQIGQFIERKRAEEALKEADRRKDEFLATLAHELRGPLAPLRHMLEIIKRASDNRELIEQARDTMERQLDQLVRLVDDLLDVNRISRGKLELRKEHVELASVVYRSVEACRSLTDAAGHEVSVILPQETIYLYADPVRLAQVFSNLLHNACKYTPPGGRIRFAAERQGSDVIASVKDSGIGIPPDKLSTIFQLFSQVDRSLERSDGGLGIGLTLVKQFVEMHDGRVEAMSDGAGLGSEFVVRLPILVDFRQQQETPAANDVSPSAAALRILVVDDNRDAASSLAQLLELDGHETALAHDGLQAVEACEAFRPDIVLLDLGLPKLNGFEACRRILAQRWGGDVTLVALTGWGQDEDRRRAKEAGFDHHMIKPINYGELTKLLANLKPTPV